MGFVKIGDPMPITGAIDPKQGDEQALCPKCNKPLVSFGFDESGENWTLICDECDNPEIILPE